ncbi:MAG: 5-formyltetrahydrofolate cyclo-ligase [Chromatiales bacterium]|nr:5-formyltetrahydrofolate cyclo-ligase [Chromatiales bacterium]
MAPDPANDAVRRRLRAARAALSGRERRDAARSVGRILARLPEVRRARTIAFYAAIRGELDCGPAIALAWRRGQQVYLPVVRGSRLGFARHAPGTRLGSGQFGIPVPAAGRATPWRARDLDVVVAPVVAFDARGYRLGTGGGWYDRTLAFRRQRPHVRRPLFIGVAYAFQQVDTLVVHDHDIALDAIVTPRGARRFGRSARGIDGSDRHAMHAANVSQVR